VRKKHCWLAVGWRLLLEWCERKTLLTGAGAEQQNRVNKAQKRKYHTPITFTYH